MDIASFLKRRKIALPLACGAALSMLVVSESAYWQSVGRLDKLSVMAVTRSRIQGLQQSIVDAETGQRGYLLTRRPEHLLPYDKALQDIDAALGYLVFYYAGEPEAEVLLDQLQTIISAKLKQLALTIGKREGSRATVSEDIVLSDIGREQMTAIRALANALLNLEESRVTAARADLYQTLELRRLGIGALTLLCLLALTLYLRQTEALKRQQIALRQAVQAERDLLEIEVKRRTVQLTELTNQPPAIGARGRTPAPGAQPARRAWRLADLGQAGRGAHQVAADRQCARSPGAAGTPGGNPQREHRAGSQHHRGSAPLNP